MIENLEETLTEREVKLFNILRSKKVLSLDEICESEGIKSKPRTEAQKKKVLSARGSIIVRIKYLNSKLSNTRYGIARISKIGRGNKAEYSLIKKF